MKDKDRLQDTLHASTVARFVFFQSPGFPSSGQMSGITSEKFEKPIDEIFLQCYLPLLAALSQRMPFFLCWVPNSNKLNLPKRNSLSHMQMKLNAKTKIKGH